MKCILSPNFKSLSGKSGNILYKTFHRADGKTETRAYFLPRNRETGKYGYTRKSPVTQGEMESRGRFKRVSEIYASLSDETKQRYNREWEKAKYMLNGKKYCTLRGYIIARLYVDMKNGLCS